MQRAQPEGLLTRALRIVLVLQWTIDAFVEFGVDMLKKAWIVGVALVLTACGSPVAMNSLPSQVEANSGTGHFAAGSIVLDDPVGLAEDKAGNLYVANAGSSQILIYNSKNEQQTAQTITDGVKTPLGLAFDKSGDLYASDSGADQVTVYSPSRKLIKTLHTVDSNGLSPSGVQIASDGSIWVASRNPTNSDVGEVQVFSSSGKVLHSSKEQLGNPLGIVFVGSDAWVCNSSQSYDIAVFDSTAKLLKTISTPGIPPTYAAKNSKNDVYVTDEAASLIAVLDSSGKILKTAKGHGLDNPSGIAFNKAGDYYVSEEGSNTITEYDSGGKLIHTIK
jgi:DNA-binding beta-propeller fold protein YncE